MRADRAWVRLGSGRRLDLLDLRPDAWTDEDLATGLAFERLRPTGAVDWNDVLRGRKA